MKILLIVAVLAGVLLLITRAGRARNRRDSHPDRGSEGDFTGSTGSGDSASGTACGSDGGGGDGGGGGGCD